MDKKLCGKLADELKALKELRGQIGRAYGKALDTKDFGVCGELRQKIKQVLDGPESEISMLRENQLPPELKKLKLKEQYESQVQVAWKSGLFGKEVLAWATARQLHRKQMQMRVEGANSQLPVIERGGRRFPMPTWKEVQRTLRKNKEIIKEKSKQGFTKMLIVPFGYNLKTMLEWFQFKVWNLDQAGRDKDGIGEGIFGAGGEEVDFDITKSASRVSIWEGWDEEQLVYYPQKYDQKDHGGLTKEDAIKINGAWQICFAEDMPVIPLEGKEVGGRKQIDRKGSWIKGQTGTPSIKQFKEAMDNKRKMVNPEKYKNESGMTPEKYLWLQLTSLLANEKPVLMDYENNEYRGTYLIECFHVSSLSVPLADWNQSTRWINLARNFPDARVDDFGVRSSVNIK